MLKVDLYDTRLTDGRLASRFKATHAMFDQRERAVPRRKQNTTSRSSLSPKWRNVYVSTRSFIIPRKSYGGHQGIEQVHFAATGVTQDKPDIR